MMFEQTLQTALIAREVSQSVDIPQSESKRLKGMIEADQFDGTSGFTRGAQHRHRIGRCAQAHVPNHKFTRVLAQPPRQIQLPHIKRLRLCDRTDDRMERLAMRQRVDAARPVGQLDDTIGSGGLHSQGNNPLIRFASWTRLMPMLSAASRMGSFSFRLKVKI